MMNKEQRESWTRLVDVSTSRRWFDGVILAADAELTALRQQRDELLSPEKMAESLFRSIKHGDVEHQEWLKQAAMQWATRYCTIAKAKGTTP